MNARGDDSLTVINPTDPSVLVDPTINLAKNTHLLMQGEMRFAGGYDINGGPRSEIINEGSIIAGRAISHTINTNIVGDGLIEVDPATMGPALYTINGRVGGGQTFELTRTALYPATLDIKQPHTFHGLIDAPPDVLVRANVILEGLTATSYSVKGDILQLYNCNKRVDTLRLSNPADQPLSVGQSGSNVVLAFNETAPGMILPTHGFA